MTKYETVTVKVPKNLMLLIQDQNYFGRVPDKFFADCVKRGVGCEMSRMPIAEVKRLERKFKVESELVVDLSEATLVF